MDSGSADFWIGTPSSAHRSIDSRSSSTFFDSGSAFSVTYGSFFHSILLVCCLYVEQVLDLFLEISFKMSFESEILRWRSIPSE